MANAKKQTQIDKITAFLQKNPSFTLLKFDKTSHIALEGLRKQLKKNEAQVMVVKNTVLQKAINKMATTKENTHLREFQKKAKNVRENTAVVGFSHDWSKGMNAFNDFAKNDKTVTFKVGLLDQITYEGADLERIASLPSKNELVGKVLGSMKSPVAHFTNALKFNMQKIVYILNAKSKTA